MVQKFVFVFSGIIDYVVYWNYGGIQEALCAYKLHENQTEMKSH